MDIRDYFSSKRVQRFLIYGNLVKKYPRWTDEGIPIHILQFDDRLSIFLEIGENDTQDALRTAITLAMQWKRLLVDWENENLANEEDYIIGLLVHCHNQKIASYKGLAKILNQTISDLLNEYSRYKDECEALGLKPEGPRGKAASQIEADPTSYGQAYLLLDAIRIKKDDRQPLLHYGLSNIKNGREPFLEDQPISGIKIREILRPYKSGGKKLVISDIESLLNYPLCREIYERLI